LEPTRDQHCHAQSNQRPVEDVLIFDLKGNVTRSRGQKHQNISAFRNDKYGATVQVKKANSKIHDGLCQHCKGVLEWKVKYKKYKTLTQAKKCVKCSQKTVKDAYYIICKPCSLQLEICCKCGKKEEIVIPLNSHEDKEEDDEQKKKRRGRGKKDLDDLDSDDDYNDDDDDDDDLSDLRGDDGDKGADLESDSEPKKQQNGSDVLPDVSTVSFKD
uniref:Chromosome 9 open reading frame 85 n=1 Tax=Gasterosteus aculeatus aculeatus TaxID=481459 RepID=A0AAQ4RKV2_GASAC